MITKNIKSVIVILFAAAAFTACKKTDYTFGELKTPSNLEMTAVVNGADATNPDGDGTGKVAVAVTAANVLSYKMDFGDGTAAQMVQSGSITYKYNNPGTSEYTITVNAIGRGGVMSTISKKVKVFVAFEIPADIIAGLTNGSSRIWMSDKDAPGHFGVGPSDQFEPIWYAAAPNSRDACSYDDEITFTKNANNTIAMSIDNKGQSFSIGASTAYYGFGGGDACLGLDASGSKNLVFMGATSGSTSAVSTGIQFMVPGNGIISFGTGGNTYEILSVSATNLHVRSIGIDGNAWYQKFKVKP